MKEFLEKIRIPDNNLKLNKKIINTSLIFLLGIALGVFSKWLDNLSIDDKIWWQHILGILDLNNVFSLFGIWILIATTTSVFSKTPLRASLNVFLFFVGMIVSYHLYTICFSGFNSKNYNNTITSIYLLVRKRRRKNINYYKWYNSGYNANIIF